MKDKINYLTNYIEETFNCKANFNLHDFSLQIIFTDIFKDKFVCEISVKFDDIEHSPIDSYCKHIERMVNYCLIKEVNKRARRKPYGGDIPWTEY